MNLSQRLTKVKNTVINCETVCDIGCDHGFVSISLIKEGKAKISYKVGGKTRKITVTVKKKAGSSESKPENKPETVKDSPAGEDKSSENNNEVCVVYKRGDGSYGLIVPEEE